MESGHELFRWALRVRDTDPAGAAVALAEAEDQFVDTGEKHPAAECALARARLAAEGLDLALAVALARRAADRFSSRPTRRADAYLLAGHAAAADLDAETARRCFALAARSPVHRAEALESLGLLEFEHGDLSRAEYLYRRSWAAMKEATRLQVASLHERFAELALAKRDNIEACLSYATAIRALDDEQSAEGFLMKARLRTDLSDLWASMGRISEAIRGYEQVLEYYESSELGRRADRIRRRIAALQWRSEREPMAS